MEKVFLNEILSQPTAPFRETHVVRCILKRLRDGGVPHFRDPAGNIVLGAATPEQYRHKLAQGGTEPVRFFMAHMDHPGFHGVQWVGKDRLKVKWMGGSPRRLLKGAKVWLADDAGFFGQGTLSQVVLSKSKLAIDTAAVDLTSKHPEPLPSPESLYGAFRFRAPVWQTKKIFHTKAADDLVGSFVIASLALSLYKGDAPPEVVKARGRFLGLLTRAEEVGFIGAIAHFQLGWLKARSPVLCVSLETSRTLPGAEVGKGPVVRLGDRATTFDPGALHVFTQLAQKKIPGKFQRRIMDGGTCEGTVALAFGFPTVGISIPLGNYHNQSFEGGPGSRGSLGPAPEFVHEDDIEGMLSLCTSLLDADHPWHAPWNAKLDEFQGWVKNYQPLLAQIPE